MNDKNTFLTSMPLTQRERPDLKPETFRLPKHGERDPHFGLSRTAFYELEAAGAIRLIRLRKRGNLRGTTLIPFDQVAAYVRKMEAHN
jgi:hypothetical protein